MISLKELLSGADEKSIPKEHLDNLNILLERVNKVRTSWNRPMTVTSGYRSMEHHLEIYKSKGITDPKKIPMKSKHLYGQAVDFFDPKKELQAWCKANEPLLQSIGLWMEDFSATPNWVHFQIIPPASGKRWFLP